MKHNLMRNAAVLLIVMAAVVGILQLSADVAEAYGCTGPFRSCLTWCAGSGSAIYGDYGTCRSACDDMYCQY